MEAPLPAPRPARLLTRRLSLLEGVVYSAWAIATVAAVAAFAYQIFRMSLERGGCMTGVFAFGCFIGVLLIPWVVLLIAHFRGDQVAMDDPRHRS